MTLTDFIATLALVISAGTLTLELRRWVESGPQLSLNIMADATLLPVDDGKEKLLLTVTNRAGVPTQVTHMLVFAFHSRLHAPLRRKPYISGFIKGPGALLGNDVPAKIDIGDRWMGVMLWADDTKKARAKGDLYVGVQASHRQRNYIKRVPRPAKKLNTLEGA